jgi:hypothetical protein
MEISFSNLYLDEMLALQKFINSTNFDFFSNFSKNPEEAHEIIDSFKKIKKVLKNSLPPAGLGPFFDADFPDGSNAFIVELTKDECVALSAFSRKIHVEALTELLGTKSAGTYAMRSMWAIRDALHSHGLNF